jgi:hypothetical protein
MNQVGSIGLNKSHRMATFSCSCSRHCLGVNLTTEDSLGQLDAYVQNGEWDLEGRHNRDDVVI